MLLPRSPFREKLARILEAVKKVSILSVPILSNFSRASLSVTSSGDMEQGILSTMTTLLRINVLNGLNWILSKEIHASIRFSETARAALPARNVWTTGICNVRMPAAMTTIKLRTVYRIIFNAFLISLGIFRNMQIPVVRKLQK